MYHLSKTVKTIAPLLFFTALFLLPVSLLSAEGKKETTQQAPYKPVPIEEEVERLEEMRNRENLPAVTGPLAPPYTPEELVASALKNNRELKGLRTDTKKSLLEIKQAKAERLPELDFAVNLSHIANPPTLELSPGDLGSIETEMGTLEFPEEKMTVNLGTESTNYEFKLSLDQPVFTWGKINNSIKLHTRKAGANALTVESKVNELRTMIYSYIATLYFLDIMEDLVKKQIETGERLIFISEKSHENGFILYTDLLETRIRVQEIYLARTQIESRKKEVMTRLELATSLDDLSMEEISFGQFDEEVTNYVLASEEALIDTAFEKSIDLKLLEQQRAIMAHKLDIAEGKSYLKPDIGLHFELSYGGPRFPLIETDWYGEDDYNLTSTIGLTTKLFDGGRLKQEIEINREELEGSLYAYERGKSQIRQVITETMAKLELNKSTIEYLNLKIGTDREQMEIKKTQFETGAGPEREYRQAQLTLYSDMIERCREKIHFFQNYFTVRYVTNTLPEPEE